MAVAAHCHKYDESAAALKFRISLGAVDASICLVATAVSLEMVASQLHSDPSLAFSAHSLRIRLSLCFGNP